MYEPRVVCFFCKWCTYAGADLAGTSRKQYPPNGVVVRVNCTGRVDPQHVLWAFREGADGVLIGGCHPGDCHYQEGNYKTMRRMPLLHRLLEGLGVEPARLRLEWISAAEGDRLVRVMDEFVSTVRDLGPLELPDEICRGRGREPWAVLSAPGAEATERKATGKAAGKTVKKTKRAAAKKAVKKGPVAKKTAKRQVKKATTARTKPAGRARARKTAAKKTTGGKVGVRAAGKRKTKAGARKAAAKRGVPRKKR